MLALALAKPSNFLVLDEPTNDLDMDTLDLLQEALDEYTGTILIVSHDRDFLDKVCSSLLYMKGDGTITEYVGTYSDLLAGEKEKALNAQKKTTVKKVVKTASVAEVPASPAPKKKLSFKEQHLLKTLPAEIEKLQTQVANLEAKLNDPTFYAQNPDEFTKTTIELTSTKEQLETAEMTWLELEILQEEILGQK